MRRLDKEIEIAQENCQYVVLFDKTENAQVFFDYKATLRDFHKEILRVKLKKAAKEDVLEVIRKGLMYCMRSGDTFVLNLSKMCPDFHVEYNHVA